MPKRIGYIFEKVVDKDNLRLAIKNASNNKLDHYSVKRVLANPEKYVDKIHTMLVSGTWTPSKYTEFYKRETPTSKLRYICAPRFFPDLIIQWAVMQIIEPILNKGLYRHSYCNVKGRGSVKAAKSLEHIMRVTYRGDINETRYCLKVDIKKYYDHVSIPKLKELLERKIKDRRFLDQILFPILDTKNCLPLGNYTSQVLANFYLQTIDEYICNELSRTGLTKSQIATANSLTSASKRKKYIQANRKFRFYVRYMDDMVFLAKSKKVLHRIRYKLSKKLSEEFGCDLKDNYQVFDVTKRRIDFCGYTISHKNTHIRSIIKKKIIRNYRDIINKNKYTLCRSRRYQSYKGWILNSNSEYIQVKYVKNKITKSRLKDLIKAESEKFNLIKKRKELNKKLNSIFPMYSDKL